MPVATKSGTSFRKGQNSIHLSQLSKGDNSLEIKSTDANGHWNETQSQVLHIYRAPWWYETYAAYFLYVLGAVAVLFIYIRHVLKRQQAKKPTGSPETNGRDEIPILHQYQPRTTHATDTHHRAIGIPTEKGREPRHQKTTENHRPECPQPPVVSQPATRFQENRDERRNIGFRNFQPKGYAIAYL